MSENPVPPVSVFSVSEEHRVIRAPGAETLRNAVLWAVDSAIASTGMTPSTDQRDAVVKLVGIVALHRSGRRRMERTWEPMTGHAGSGKTTVMQIVALALALLKFDVIFAAPTGKAAARLRDVLSGAATRNPTFAGLLGVESVGADGTPKTTVHVSTIHGLIYGHPVDHGICPECLEPSKDLAKPSGELAAQGLSHWTCPACSARIPLDTVIGSMLVFARPEAKEGLSRDTVLIIDEASMIPSDMLEDIVGHMKDRPIIMVGDPGQLPPVSSGEQRGVEVSSPALEGSSIHLTQIHRQGAGSAIIHAANLARSLMGRSVLNLKSGNGLVIRSHSRIRDVVSWAAGLLDDGEDCAVVCYTNKMREHLNGQIRAKRVRSLVAEAKGRGEAPVSSSIYPGERLVCIANNHGQGVMNGEILDVLAVRASLAAQLLEVDIKRDGEVRTFLVCPEAFGREYREFDYEVRNLKRTYSRAVETWSTSGPLMREFPRLTDYLKAMRIPDTSVLLHVSYGYALTVHKAQGSQWDKVAYVWETATWGMAYKDEGAFAKHLYTGITRAVTEVTIFALAKGETAPDKTSTASRGWKDRNRRSASQEAPPEIPLGDLPPFDWDS